MAKKKVDFKGLTIEEISNIIEKGLRIRSFEASDIASGRIYKTSKKGEHYIKSNTAVLPNSIFTTLLIKNGLTIENGETEDVIYLDFKGNVKTEKGYLKSKINGIKDDIKSLGKKISKAKNDEVKNKLELEKRKQKAELKKLQSKYKTYDKKTDIVDTKREDLRRDWYEHGFDLKILDKEGNLIRTDHYEVIFQSSSKSRLGKTIFLRSWSIKKGGKNKKKHINVEKVRDEMTMGLHSILDETIKVDIVSLEAYSSLIESAITDGYIKINPKNILVIKDKKVEVKCKAVICKENESKDNFIIESDNNYTDINVLFDGQSLLDESYFKGKHYGFMLLRQHMFKSACFKCKLKDYIKNWCAKNGKDYYNDTVEDMFGHKIKYCDIEMITTDNSLKFWKFKSLFNVDDIYEYWSSKVAEYENLFSIVKYDKPTKYGKLVRHSYQMINSLDCGDTLEEITDNLTEICKPTGAYISKLRNDRTEFENYMATKLKTDSSSIFWRKMIELGIPVDDIKDFNDYWKDATKKIQKEANKGGLLLEGGNLTLVMNPVEMVQQALIGNCEPTFKGNSDYVKCYTTKYKIGEVFSGMRSPHNANFNCCLFENMDNEEVKKLFGDLSENIIVIDGFEKNVQSILNGADQDSDFICTTNNPTVVKCIKRTWGKVSIAVNAVSMEEPVYYYSLKDKAEANIRLASNTIGEITNKAQILVSQLQHKRLEEPDYDTSKMEEMLYGLVIATNLSIDGAKRLYNLCLLDYLKIIDKDEEGIWLKDDNGRMIPEFFKDITQNKLDDEEKAKKYRYMNCNIDIISEGGIYTNRSGEVKKCSLVEIDKPRAKNKHDLSYYIIPPEDTKAINYKCIDKDDNNLLDIFTKYYGEWDFARCIEDWDVVNGSKMKCKKVISHRNLNINTMRYLIGLCWDDNVNNRKWHKMRMFIMEVLIDTFPEKMAICFRNK